MRRTLVVAAALGVLLIALAAGCGSKKSASSSADDHDELILGDLNRGDDDRGHDHRGNDHHVVRLQAVVRVDEELRPARLTRLQAHELE